MQASKFGSQHAGGKKKAKATRRLARREDRARARRHAVRVGASE